MKNDIFSGPLKWQLSWGEEEEEEEGAELLTVCCKLLKCESN